MENETHTHTIKLSKLIYVQLEKQIHWEVTLGYFVSLCCILCGLQEVKTLHKQNCVTFSRMQHMWGERKDAVALIRGREEEEQEMSGEQTEEG